LGRFDVSLMKYLYKLLLLLTLVIPSISEGSSPILTSEAAEGQDNYPVSCVPMVGKGQRQLSQYLSSTEGLKVNLILKDLDKEQIDVYLRLKISGIGIVIANPEGFIPAQKITLQRGSLVTLSGSQLEEYFNPANLQAQGIDQSFLYQGGSLPQGSYRIEVTAYEVDRNRQVSNRGEVNTFVFLADPPLLISPRGSLMATYPQRVMFQWQLPVQPFTDPSLPPISYTLKLAKVGSISPAEDALNRPDSIISVGDILLTSYILTDAAALLLEEGQQYVWQIQVSQEYRHFFNNSGKSNIAVFTYQSPPCNAPTGLTGHTSIGGYTVKWNAVPEATAYRLEYKELSATDWIAVNAPLNTAVLDISNVNTQYYLRVSSVCRPGQSSVPSDSVFLDNALNQPYTRPEELQDPQEDPLDAVLNPFSNPIVITNGTPGTPPTVEELLENLRNLPPPQCSTDLTEGVSCTDEETIEYTGSEEFDIVPGSLLAIKGFKVVVTEGGPNGKGILYYNAFGGLPVSVVFNGVKAYRDATGQNGCVYDGEMPVEGSDNTVLDRDVQSRLLAIYNRNNNPTSYAGSFDQALKDLKDKAEELKDKSEITHTDWTQLNTYIVASNKGFSDWKDDVNAAFGNDVPVDVQTALTRLGEIEDELTQLSACATENIPQGGGGDNYLNLTAMLRLACVMQFDKLIAKQGEAGQVERTLQKVFWPKLESKRFEAIPYETVTLYEMSSWDDEDDELGNLTINVVQIGESEFTEADMSECSAVPVGPPGLTPAQIREMFYADILAVDMNDCPANYGGRKTTYTSPARVPRNPAYYWGKLLEKQNKGEIAKLLSDNNIKAIGNRNFEGIKIDDDWIKVCPKHAPYKGQTFAHHHVDRINIAVGLPRDFHNNYSKQLHWGDDVLEKLGKYCEDKKLPNNKGRFVTKGLGTVSIAFMFLDVVKMFKGDPTAGWNVFARPSEKGKLYYIAEKDMYLMPVKITKTATEASMEYKLYNGYDYDSQKKKYIGVGEIGTFCEHYNHVTKQSSVLPGSCTL
jgi:hypothetical protein